MSQPQTAKIDFHSIPFVDGIELKFLPHSQDLKYAGIQAYMQAGVHAYMQAGRPFLPDSGGQGSWLARHGTIKEMK